MTFKSESGNQSIDFSRYVALGDSITAGYMDGALYYQGQIHSYPAILAKQIKQHFQLDFNQPLMHEKSPGVNQDGESRLILKQGNENNNYTLSHFSEQGDLDAFKKNEYAKNGPYQNMGVAGVKVINIGTNGYGNAANGAGNYNPFFGRMTSNIARASILSDALLTQPSFFSLFIGNNDALAYALSGGTIDTITSVQVFENSLKSLVNDLTNNGARGIIANLPSILDIPYFTCIPYNGLLLNKVEKDSLNQVYAGRGIRFFEGENSFVMVDPTDKYSGIRQITKGEFISLDVLLDQEKDLLLSGKKPIPKKYTLTHAQIAEVTEANCAYNNIIHKLAVEKNLAFVDVRALLKTAKPDRFYNPTTRGLNYARKGVFSLDGLHPNSFGQALMANEFIKTINNTYDCDFSMVRSHGYPGINFPAK
jgi:lysophospholipase L1-like esterase